MIKIDSSSLIYVTKLKLFDLLVKFYKDIIISPAVKREVIDDGLKRRKADAIIIQQFLIQEKIRIHKPVKLIQNLNLGIGETEIISLSIEENCPCMLDDIKAQRIGIGLQLELKSTPIFLLELLKNGHLDLQSYELYIDEYGKMVNLSRHNAWFYKKVGSLIK
ncbi:MAG: hypothetical protein ACTSVY_03125 [Candidatus Helarchaeota archaeon]